ncbi:MAG: AAA family ATPase [Parcubacteria group bacterium]|nr:AAA family ATPase [Parcubacteria group bacterium]
MEQKKYFTESEANDFRIKISEAVTEIHKEVIGFDEEIYLSFVAILAINGGHILAEGEPGIGKTIFCRTIPRVFDAQFSRVQFTADLLPFDILLGFGLLENESLSLEKLAIRPGALFTDFLLADEFNRAPHKTQGVLIEAAEEKQITLEGKTKTLSPLFTIFATQNDIEIEGTYGLSEAVADRFLFKLYIVFPDKETLEKIIMRDQLPKQFKKIFTPEEICAWRLRIYQQYIVSQSPRLALYTFFNKRNEITQEDIKRVALPALRGRFRISLSKAEEAGIPRGRSNTMIDSVIRSVLDTTPLIA